MTSFLTHYLTQSEAKDWAEDLKREFLAEDLSIVPTSWVIRCKINGELHEFDTNNQLEQFFTIGL